MKLRTTSVTVAILMSAFCFIQIGPVAALAEDEPEQQQRAITQTRVDVDYDHPIRLTDAVRLTEVLYSNVVAYRFQGDQIAGEYSPQSGVSVESYLEDFGARLGTEPEVIGFTLPAEGSPSKTRATAPPIPDSIPEFHAPPVSESFVNSRRALNEQQRQPQQARSLLGGDWRPNLAQMMIQDQGSTIHFEYALSWDSPTSPIYIPSDWGMETGVELYNGASSTALRPFCNSGYKEAFFAKNYGWNWWVFDESFGAIAAAQPYADYNDLEDPCNRNSISIGLASPQYIPLAYYNAPYDWVIFIWVDAPQGTQTTNTISSSVGLVTKGWCTSYPSYAWTDCMGVSAAGSPVDYTQRPVLAASRSWAAPDKCWTSTAKGTVAPTLTLPTPTGC